MSFTKLFSFILLWNFAKYECHFCLVAKFREILRNKYENFAKMIFTEIFTQFLSYQYKIFTAFISHNYLHLRKFQINNLQIELSKLCLNLWGMYQSEICTDFSSHTYIVDYNNMWKFQINKLQIFLKYIFHCAIFGKIVLNFAFRKI